MAAWLDGIGVRDIVAPLVTLFVGILGSHATHRAIRHNERDKTEVAKVAAAAQHHQAEAVTADSLTKRFQALMDGYESQIAFLTDEVRSLRGEVETLRREIADHRRRCADCPYASA